MPPEASTHLPPIRSWLSSLKPVAGVRAMGADGTGYLTGRQVAATVRFRTHDAREFGGAELGPRPRRNVPMSPAIGFQDATAIAGIAQTSFAEHLEPTEAELACTVIVDACADAGIDPSEIDALC